MIYLKRYWHAHKYYAGKLAGLNLMLLRNKSTTNPCSKVGLCGRRSKCYKVAVGLKPRSERGFSDIFIK